MERIYTIALLSLLRPIEVDPFSEAYTYGSVVRAPSIVVEQQVVSFGGEKNSSGVDLEWQANELKDFTLFEVQRSADGNQFESIGEVGGSEKKAAYRFGDNKVIPGNNYYRLKMTDLQGHEIYSKTILFQFSEKSKVKIWPNPATDKIVINQPGNSISSQSIRLINAAGQSYVPAGINNTANTVELKVANLPSGVYWLELKQKDGLKIVERILIRH